MHDFLASSESNGFLGYLIAATPTLIYSIIGVPLDSLVVSLNMCFILC